MLTYNPALIFVVLAASVGVIVSALALVFSMAPGWREERLLALIGGSAALFSVFDVVTYVPGASMHLRVTLGDISQTVAALHIAVWTLYSARQRGTQLDRTDRATLGVLALLGLCGLVPGLAYSSRLEIRDVPWLGVRYYDPTP